MALVPCPDCGRSVSDAAPACPGCGRPMGRVPSLPPAGQRRSGSRFAIGCLVLLGIAAIGNLISSTSRESPTPPQTPAGRRIPYEVVQSWRIPNGGYGKVILIEPVHRNALDLRLLGEQLRREMASDRNAGVEVFDNLRAARMRQDAVTERLNAADLSFHDKHKIAFYNKNGNTGFHEYRFTLEGVLSDNWTVIRY